MVDIPPALDRAVAYGDGVFETMLAHHGAIPLLEYHQARLANAIVRLGGELDLDALWRDLLANLDKHSGIVKLNCYRSGGARGYASAGSVWQYHVTCSARPVYPLRYLQQGVVLQPLPRRLGFESALAGIKHSNRLAQIVAADLLDKSLAQDALLLDESGWLVEGLISNIALVKNGAWITPQLAGSGVDGTMRQFLLDRVGDLGLEPTVRPVLVGELASAEAVFVCNSLFGLWPVARLGLASISINHALTQALWQFLAPLGYLAAYD